LVRALRVTGGAGWARAFLAGTGPQVGIRESFHAITRDQVTEADCLAGRRRDDGIARGGWPFEVHEGLGRARYAAIGGEGSFDIPLGALIARDVPRLFVAGRLIGADAAAYGSLRVMGTAFATGHAAGIAAALAASTGRIEDVRKELQRQDAIL
ncbi:MAG: FAD-dependent oxidoreductase, partial [Acetobacteraceae bacterium]